MNTKVQEDEFAVADTMLSETLYGVHSDSRRTANNPPKDMLVASRKFYRDIRKSFSRVNIKVCVLLQNENSLSYLLIKLCLGCKFGNGVIGDFLPSSAYLD
jgi:hypothetical protein